MSKSKAPVAAVAEAKATIWGLSLTNAARAVGAHTSITPKAFIAFLDSKGVKGIPYNNVGKQLLRARRLGKGAPAQTYYKPFTAPDLPADARVDLGLPRE